MHTKKKLTIYNKNVIICITNMRFILINSLNSNRKNRNWDIIKMSYWKEGDKIEYARIKKNNLSR